MCSAPRHAVKMVLDGLLKLPHQDRRPSFQMKNAVLHKCQIVKTEIMEICFVSQLAINVRSRGKDTIWSIWYMIRKIQMVYGVFENTKG